MEISVALRRLRQWDAKGRYVFSYHMLRKIFAEDSDKAFSKGLDRLIQKEVLTRACRGVFVNPHAKSADGYLIEHIVTALRPAEQNYVSLESALSERGVISQIPVGTITVMTTGSKGRVKTQYGVIEFTHTNRLSSELVEGLVRVPGRPLRVANVQAAWRDLLRVRGREVAEQLVDKGELANECAR